MKVFNCKMCGGRLEINEDTKICECEYCNTKQTISTVDDDQLINMINRANYFRMQCEFDKASDIYNNILSQCSDDPEIYWSLVLCRYGIEYVDDPVTNKKVPTCHRVQYKSILEDPDYLEAIDIADPLRKAIYIEEAEYIHSVQMKILEISNKEKPFDVFICYKESDENGQRTQDSVLAQELYYGLTNEGFKVFFSRITLESKLGTEYEPYIFAALNSSPIMVVVGTRPEHFNAVWVKNEWSRFLLLMQDNKKKMIIPAYRDMNPYDLPEALSLFQAQDMSKLGFMQDLIRGIKKILSADKTSSSSSKLEGPSAGSANVNALLKRVSLFLEDSDWTSAKNYCNRVLDADPENALAYYYLLLCDFESRNDDDLERRMDANGITSNNNYNKVCKFGDDNLKKKVEIINKQVVYNYALNLKSYGNYPKARELFRSLGDFNDSSYQLAECEKLTTYSQAMRYKADRKYIMAKELFDSLGDFNDSVIQSKAVSDAAEKEKVAAYNRAFHLKETEQYLEAKKVFDSISDYKDSKELSLECEEKANQKTYDDAVNKKNNKNYLEAKNIFDSLGEYKDSCTQSIECEKLELYSQAVSSKSNKKYTKAISLFESLGDFKDSYSQKSECENEVQVLYCEAEQYKNCGEYDKAKGIYESLGDYKDSQDQLLECENLVVYNQAIDLREKQNYIEAVELFKSLGSFSDSISQSYECENQIQSIYESGLALKEGGNYSEAISRFGSIRKYKDSMAQSIECEKLSRYAKALDLKDNKNYKEASYIFANLGDFKDSSTKSRECEYEYYKSQLDEINLLVESDQERLAEAKKSLEAQKSIVDNYEKKCAQSDKKKQRAGDFVDYYGLDGVKIFAIMFRIGIALGCVVNYFYSKDRMVWKGMVAILAVLVLIRIIIRINYSLKKSEYESSVTLLKEERGNYQEMISKIAQIEDQIKGNKEKANEIRSSMNQYI